MYKQPYIYVAEFLPLTGGTGVSYTDFEFKIDRDNFEFIKTIHAATDNRINVKLYNSTTGRYVTQPQIDIRAFSGTAFSGVTPNGFISYILPTPLQVAAGSEMILSAADKSGSNNNLRMAFFGNRLYGGVPPWENKKKEEWNIPVNLGAISGYNSATKTVVLQENVGLLIHKITGTRSGACLVDISDEQGSWMSRPVHFDNLCGNGQFGHVLTSPKWVPPGSIISVFASDLSGSSNTVSITLQGERVYV